MTTTMREIIDYSAAMQPSLFAEQIVAVAAKHESFARWTDDPTSGDTANGMAARLRVLAKQIRDHRGLARLTMAETITLFDLASDIQCIPSDVAESICQPHHVATERVC